MARVTGKYDVDFERGEGGLKSVFGTYIGTRLKEGKEQYKRELKAADPTYEGKQLTALRKERADLLKELMGGGRSASGGSVSKSWTSGKADEAKARLKLRDTKEKKQSIYLAGQDQAGIEIGRILSLGKEGTDITSTLTNEVLPTLQDNMGAPGNTLYGKHGIGDGILEIMERENIPQDVQDKTREILAAKQFLPSDDLRKTYDDPDFVTDIEEDWLKDIGLGKAGSRETRKLGAGLDSNARNMLLVNQLKQLDAAIKKQEEVYSTAKDDYLSLARGPGRNLALAPISSRPSALSESMDMYADVYEADPRYAKEILSESSEAGRITVPDRFEGLKSIEGSEGKSPIDILMDTSSTLAILRGTTDKEGAVERTLRSDDVDLVRGSLERMRRAMKSPMFGEQKYGDIKGPGGKSMPIGKFLDDVTNQFDSVPESMKAKYAQAISDKIIEWSKTQDEKKLKAARRDYNPSSAVSQSIGRIQVARKEFDKTGDSKTLRDTMAVEYNTLNDTDKEIRGASADAALQLIDDFMATPEDNRSIDFLGSQLDDLKSVADQISVKDTGVQDVRS